MARCMAKVLCIYLLLYRVRTKCSIGDPVQDTLKFSRHKKAVDNNNIIGIQNGKSKRKEKLNTNYLKQMTEVPSEVVTVHAALRTPLPPPLVSLCA